LGGCGDDKVEGEIRKSLPRLGGGLTAILVKYEGWDDYIYRLYLRRGYDNTTWMVFWTDNNYGHAPDIAWVSPDSLVIRMQCGNIGRYENNFEYEVNGETRIAFIGLEDNKICLENLRSYEWLRQHKSKDVSKL
jgi:hypothetical protein